MVERIQKSRFPIFILIGILNTIFGYLLFSLFIFFGVHYTLAVLFSTCLGVLFNFNTTGKFVFKNKNNWLIFRFIAVYVLIYFVNIGLIKISSYFIANLYIDGALAIIFVAMLSFYLNRSFVFKARNL